MSLRQKTIKRKQFASLCVQLFVKHWNIPLCHPPHFANSVTRADDKAKFTDDAMQTILNAPRVFLPMARNGCAEWAREYGVERITADPKKDHQQ